MKSHSGIIKVETGTDELETGQLNRLATNWIFLRINFNIIVITVRSQTISFCYSATVDRRSFTRFRRNSPIIQT